MLDKLRQRLANQKAVHKEHQRQRMELQRGLQELQSRMILAAPAPLPSPSPGDGVPTDPCLEKQNAFNATLADIVALNAQKTATENALDEKGDLLLEQLAILEACRLEHPEPVPPVPPANP